MKEDTKEVETNETRLSDKTGNIEKGSVTSVDQVAIRTDKNIIETDESDSHSMRAESMIGKDGGTLDIQNTGVSLEIPPGALRRDYFVQMRIISQHYRDETELPFTSYSSVVVELLPNNVKLLKPATLTLPHYLVLKKKCGWKAKGYSSHHKEGNKPQWEEERNAHCDVTDETCGMRLYNFNWKKVQIGDDIVEAKKIMLYAAMRSSFEDEIFLDIGYYWQLPSCRDVLNLNNAIVLHERPAVFFKKGQLPLTVLFEKVVPPNWTYSEGNNAKEISFGTVTITNGSFCTFNLKRGVSDETDGCTCFFKAGQGSDLVSLNFSLKMPLRKLGKTPPEPLVVTNVKEMKEDTKEFVENKRRFSDKGKFEEGSVTSADEVSICTSENMKKDECDSHSMRAESMIGKAGGMLDIQNTGVSLKIPSGALRHDYLIQMRIIPHHYLDETELSFTSNSSVVVELLPNNVKLSKPATLILPHCLVLKKKCGWKAKVYSSHHEEGNQPQWEEEINTQCDVTNEDCVMRLYNFSWKKVQIGDDMVEAKRIMLYAAMRSSIENEIFLDIGYYWQLPSCRDFPKLNSAIVLHRIPDVFYSDGQLPLQVLFEKLVPTNWTCNEENNAKKISFGTVAATNGSFCTFVLKRGVSGKTDGCACYFKAGQESKLVELKFSLKESSFSRAEATILSRAIGTADSQEELPPAISQTKVRKRRHQESSLSRAEATTPSTGNDTADLQEKLPSAISKTRVRNNFLQDLSENIGKCWMDVGRKLQLTEEQLENLEQKCYSNLKETTYQMLLVWKRKKASAATYDVLADALRKAGRVDLQEDLLEKYQPT